MIILSFQKTQYLSVLTSPIELFVSLLMDDSL